MSEPPATKFRYGTLWGVLALLLLFGTVAAAFFVWGITDLLSNGRWVWDVPALAGGAFVALLSLLLLIGILYRVDRVRGTPHRRIELFD